RPPHLPPFPTRRSSDLSRAAAGAADRNGLMLGLARHVLGPAARAQAAAGCEVVHLQEPWLAFFGIEPPDWAPFEEALAAVRDGLDRKSTRLNSSHLVIP